jgi:hypothetical protein
MVPTNFALASVDELSRLGDKSLQFTLHEGQQADYAVPKAFASDIDLANPPKALFEMFIASRTETPPPTTITVLRNCYVLPNAAIITASGNVIRESCFPYVTPRISAHFTPWLEEARDGTVSVKLDPIEPVKGPAIYLREHGEGGFFHWMHSVFPRIDILRRHDFSTDYALLYKATQHFQKDGLRLAGRADWPVIAPAREAVQFFEELVFPSPLVQGGDFWLRSTSVGQFYETIDVPPAQTATKLYISRKGAEVRRLRNEPALLELLSRHGFAVVEAERLTFAEQLATFRNCEFMLGVHGAGLSHAVSMKPGSHLLEILHPRRFWATYRAISARRGIGYGFVVGEDPGPEVAGDAFDFDVNIEKLTEVLAKMGG